MKVSAQIKKAWREALKVQKRAYAPYSNYKVGSCLMAGTKFFVGCNVENASYGATICSERSAILQAVSSGVKKFSGLVVVTKNDGVPCGQCLQVISEFCGPDFPIYTGSPRGIHQRLLLKELLSFGFRRKDLQKK